MIHRFHSAKTVRCSVCGKESADISETLRVCLSCIRKKPEVSLPITIEAHKRIRSEFKLPPLPPKEGRQCKICVNECGRGKDKIGYCGLSVSSSREAKLSWYYDPLPTNCVADWVCAGGTGAGYPKYAYRNGPEYGYKNLAVFFHACSFDCLYCQNWHFREQTLRPEKRNVVELVSYVDKSVSCICYFGGDPTPQLPFAIRASRLALENAGNRILRICWETNGSMNKTLLKEMMRLSLLSGGTIKFDIKAWDENLHIALTGVTNRRTLENFVFASSMLQYRKVPPPIVASTLLVPGYIDVQEVKKISEFIAKIDPDIPYSLLAFHPDFFMEDMGFTSKQLAEQCYSEAKKVGLRNVRVGNVHLLI